MMMRSLERRTAVLVETPLPGSSKGAVQRKNLELIKTRLPLRRTITLLHRRLIEVTNREGSRSFPEEGNGGF